MLNYTVFSTNWQKLMYKSQQILPSVICGPNIRGSNLIRFDISHAVCSFLKLTDEIILNGCGLFFMSILEYSKDAIALFTKLIVKTLETGIRP